MKIMNQSKYMASITLLIAALFFLPMVVNYTTRILISGESVDIKFAVGLFYSRVIMIIMSLLVSAIFYFVVAARLRDIGANPMWAWFVPIGLLYRVVLSIPPSLSFLFIHKYMFNFTPYILGAVIGLSLVPSRQVQL